MRFIRVIIAAMLVLFLLQGCQKAAPSGSEAGGGKAEAEVADPAQLKTYTDPRYGFAIKYPPGWEPKKKADGDILNIANPKSEWLDLHYPGIRVLVIDTDAASKSNPAPLPKEVFTAGAPWPYIAGSSVADVKVKTAKGEVPGYLLDGFGRNTDAQVQYKGYGMYIYGTGHSLHLACSAPDADWPKWEPVCKEVMASFQAGDMTISHYAERGK